MTFVVTEACIRVELMRHSAFDPAQASVGGACSPPWAVLGMTTGRAAGPILR